MRLYKINREIIYAIFAVSGSIMISINTWNYGVGLSNDSVNYIYSGVNLFKLKGFYSVDSLPFINWPPLYPVVIFLLSIFNSSIYSLILYFNIILFSFTILLIGKLAEEIFYSPFTKIIYTFILTFSFQYLYIYTRAWSETIFIPLVVFVILLIIKDFNDKYIYLLLFLCVFTRYIGISLLFSYFFYKAYIKKDKVFNSNNFLKFIIYDSIILFLLFLWIIRSYLLSTKLEDLFIYVKIGSIINNTFHAYNSISALFIPESFNAFIRSFLFFLMIIFIIIIYRRLKINNKVLKISYYFSAIYILMLVVLSSVMMLDEIAQRFVTPIYFVILIFFILPFDYYLKTSKKKEYKILISLCLLSFAIFPIEKGIKHTLINHKNGLVGFHSREWIESESIKYIRSNLFNYNIYSNSAEGIYSNTGFKSKRLSNYFDNNDTNSVRIVFNDNLPLIYDIPDLMNHLSYYDSIIYFNDSYIIFSRKK